MRHNSILKAILLVSLFGITAYPAEDVDPQKQSAWLEDFPAQGSRGSLAETPTHTPTPSPKPTANPWPVSTVLVPNITAHHQLILEDEVIYLNDYMKMAFHPKDGSLFFFQYTPQNTTIQIRGPYHPSQAIARFQDIPIYYEKKSDVYYNESRNGMVIAEDGTIYIALNNQLLQIHSPHEIQIYSTAIFNENPNEDDFYYDPLADWYIVRPGDVIHGAQAGDLLAVAPFTYQGIPGIRIMNVRLSDGTVRFEILGELHKGYRYRDMTVGPDRRLYFLFTPGSNSTIILMRWESNGSFTEILQKHRDPFNFVKRLEYWPADDAFYTLIGMQNSRRRYLYRIDPRTGKLNVILFSNIATPLISVSPADGRLFYSNYTQDQPARHFLESLTLDRPFPTPTPPSSGSPSFPTALPEDYPTVTPTPTYTVTPTFTPIPTVAPPAAFYLLPIHWPEMPLEDDRRYSVEAIDTTAQYMAVHPVTGDVVTLGMTYIDRDTIRIRFDVVQPAQIQIDMDQFPPESLPHFEFYGPLQIQDMKIDSEGRIYILADKGLGEYDLRNIEDPDRWFRVPENGDIILGRRILIVPENHRIPGAQAGEILLLRNKINRDWRIEPTNEVVRINPREETPALVPIPLLDDELKDRPFFEDMAIGPDGHLYFITNIPSKILVLGQDGVLQEYIHRVLPGRTKKFVYLPGENAFYLLRHYDWIAELARVSEDGSEIAVGLARKRLEWNLWPSPDGSAVYFLEPPRIHALHYTGPAATPTPTPAGPVPTPTPIHAWFVLDGFGGIHSSNPEVRPPVLPYFVGFDIVRDIEPDPHGRGWYMLDGYGGIHRSPADLPAPPAVLPYFGFDIARDLEIQDSPDGYKFYLLDGLGAVHTNDAEFQFGYLPWAPYDVMRALEPDPRGDGWLTMDHSGYIYSSARPWIDCIGYQATYSLFPTMRGFVRFPDETTVMIDYYGGRHTNPFYPAVDVVKGLSADFYFPGWEIIWDVEAVPKPQ
ncbi:MAG: hypothetical protein ACE15F_14485 [bacterium]